MPKEIEAKFKVAAFSAVRRALLKAGAVFLGSAVQTDLYFDWPDGSLRDSDRGLRIRSSKRVRSGAAEFDARPMITFKGPVDTNSRVKIRTELQTFVDDQRAMSAIFEALGLVPTLTIGKKRSSYSLLGTTVELDELPLIGKFVEIEAPTEAKLHKIRQKLGLADVPMKDHYINLMLAAAKSKGRKGTVFTF
jgi:predicted adenylyl cyclase CyaB